MDATERKALEVWIRAHHDAGELTNAATVAINGYGSEILSYLMAVLRHETEASARATAGQWERDVGCALA